MCVFECVCVCVCVCVRVCVCVCVCAANRRADSTDMQIIVRDRARNEEEGGRMEQKRRKEAPLLLPIVSLDLPHL